MLSLKAFSGVTGLWNSADAYIAPSCLDTGQRVPGPRPRQRTLRNEDTQRTIDRSGKPELGALHVRRSTTYEAEQVTYMSDSLGLHRIENPSDSEVAISLHLYTVSSSTLSRRPAFTAILPGYHQAASVDQHSCYDGLSNCGDT